MVIDLHTLDIREIHQNITVVECIRVDEFLRCYLDILDPDLLIVNGADI